jgi:flagellar biosynthetic protein FliR
MEYFVYHFKVFLLILVRMNAMMSMAPFYSSGALPFRIRTMLSVLITIVIFPIVAGSTYNVPSDMGGYTVLVLQEVMIGLLIGFLVAVIFAAFQLSGQYFAVQIGFGINEVIDPLAQVSIPLIGQLKNLIALLVFLAIGGHHFMIKAIYRSYELAPVMNIDARMNENLMKWLMYSFSGMFVVALKISLPIVATIFLISVSMGILAKAAPQMNIMMLGFPFKIVVAFGVMILITPLMIRIMHVSLERSFKFISKVIQYWPA